MTFLCDKLPFLGSRIVMIVHVLKFLVDVDGLVGRSTFGVSDQLKRIVKQRILGAG